MKIDASIIEVRALTTPEEISRIVKIQDAIWGKNEVVPQHILLAITHDGGLALGAYYKEEMVAFTYGFVGLHKMGDQTLVKHCSHQLGVLPEYRDAGLGFKLKRAQWQLVRQQGLDLITWTYDPMETRNGNLNIAKLGAVCNSYLPDFYGELTDAMNAGVPSDRFSVDLWVNSDRVKTRLGGSPRRRLDLADFLAAEVPVLNTTQLNEDGLTAPHQDELHLVEDVDKPPNMVLFEVPANFQSIKSANIDLAIEWRLYSRKVFQMLFEKGYIVTDFVFLKGKHARAYYVLSFGESLLGVK
jgi:predicted GNAT superfamily acetyltransferase